MLELELIITLSQRAENHFSARFGEQYPAIKEKCLAVLAKIVASPEFATTVEQVTDAQATFIVEQNVNYSDITVDPSAFPLEQKIKDELAIAGFDDETEQLFNVLYVTIATNRGSKLLIKKLEVKEKELIAERAALLASD